MPQANYHVHALAAAITADPNGEIQLFPDGIVKPFHPADKRGPWKMDEKTANALIAEFNARGQPLALDYEHQTLRAVENGKEAPASGWMTKLIWRAGEGLFALVEWTAKAHAAILAKEYLYISPVFASDGPRITSLSVSALTNNPALVGMAAAIALSAQFSARMNAPAATPPKGNQGTMKMDELLKQLRQMLGLPDDADEAAIIAALKKYQTDMQEMAAKKPDAMTADPSKFIALSAFEQLKQEFVALSAKVIGSEVSTLVDAALAQGKLLPAQKAWAMQLGQQNLQSLTAYLATAPQINALTNMQTGGVAPAGGNQSLNALTHDDMELARQFGIDPAKLLGAGNGQ